MSPLNFRVQGEQHLTGDKSNSNPYPYQGRVVAGQLEGGRRATGTASWSDSSAARHFPSVGNLGQSQTAWVMGRDCQRSFCLTCILAPVRREALFHGPPEFPVRADPRPWQCLSTWRSPGCPSGPACGLFQWTRLWAPKPSGASSLASGISCCYLLPLSTSVSISPSSRSLQAMLCGSCARDHCGQHW